MSALPSRLWSRSIPEGSSVIDEDTGETRPNWEIALEMADRLRSNAVAAVPSTMAEAGMGESSNIAASLGLQVP